MVVELAVLKCHLVNETVLRHGIENRFGVNHEDLALCQRHRGANMNPLRPQRHFAHPRVRAYQEWLHLFHHGTLGVLRVADEARYEEVRFEAKCTCHEEVVVARDDLLAGSIGAQLLPHRRAQVHPESKEWETHDVGPVHLETKLSTQRRRQKFDHWHVGLCQTPSFLHPELYLLSDAQRHSRVNSTLPQEAHKLPDFGPSRLVSKSDADHPRRQY
mmetsp:Transcript_46032/g.122048  ORF Transcript_46032/g.122048 Transcript_46032/m.122048 type:complete len:216 (-) Transcript_46032:518-1165(-)